MASIYWVTYPARHWRSQSVAANRLELAKDNSAITFSMHFMRSSHIRIIKTLGSYHRPHNIPVDKAVARTKAMIGKTREPNTCPKETALAPHSVMSGKCT